MQLAFILLDVSRSSLFPHKIPTMVLCPPEGGTMLWVPPILALLIVPDSVVYTENLLSFKTLKV